MRNLTAKQKKLLDQFFESRKRNNRDEESICGSIFKNGDHGIGLDELFLYEPELYVKIEQINDTEILHQTIERYLSDKSFKYIYDRN